VSGLKVRTGVLVLAPLLLSVGGCHSLSRKFTVNACNKPQPYQSQKSDPPLKIPPGFDAPDTGGGLKLPALNEPAPPPRTVHDPCLDSPPSYKVAKPAPAPQA
jgi:hypothetical protein